MADSKWIDQDRIRKDLADFFQVSHDAVHQFGNTVNQTFEAFVFAAVAEWYRINDWKVEVINRDKGPNGNLSLIKLKYSTRGRPENYSYVKATKGDLSIQVRHQLRVATRHHQASDTPPAVLTLDVAVVRDADLSSLNWKDYVENEKLVTFGEAKHMPAFAELIAGFEGLVLELLPERLGLLQLGASPANKEHPKPFLYVSGLIQASAQGIVNSMERRGLEVGVFCRTRQLAATLNLPVIERPAKKRRKTTKAAAAT